MNIKKSKKEISDLNTIDAGVKFISDFQGEDIIVHFIYCGYLQLIREESRNRLEEIFRTKMKTYGIKSAILTKLGMWRQELVTKEKVKQAYEGKLKNEKGWRIYETSIHDDLESFFTDLQNQKEIKNETVLSFFTPKLTEKELKLVEQRNQQHLSSYSKHYDGFNPDVDAEEMKKSDSSSKFVHGRCYRWTTLLTLESKRKQATENYNTKAKKKCVILFFERLLAVYLQLNDYIMK